MTPQELMDLPWAGDAQKQLIKQGDWNPSRVVYLIEEWSIGGTMEIVGAFAYRMDAAKALNAMSCQSTEYDYILSSVEVKECK